MKHDGVTMIRRQSIQAVVTAALITVAAVLFSMPLLAAQSSPSVVAVLIPGAAYKPVLEGLRPDITPDQLKDSRWRCRSSWLGRNVPRGRCHV